MHGGIVTQGDITLRWVNMGRVRWPSDSQDTHLVSSQKWLPVGSLGRVRVLHWQTSAGQMLDSLQDDPVEQYRESGHGKKVDLNCKFKPLLPAKWTSDCPKLVGRWRLYKDLSFLTQRWADFLLAVMDVGMCEWFIDENLVRVTACSLDGKTDDGDSTVWV